MRSSIDYLDPGVNEEGGPVDCGREGLLGVDHDGDFAVVLDGDGEVGALLPVMKLPAAIEKPPLNSIVSLIGIVSPKVPSPLP